MVWNMSPTKPMLIKNHQLLWNLFVAVNCNEGMYNKWIWDGLIDTTFFFVTHRARSPLLPWEHKG